MWLPLHALIHDVVADAYEHIDVTELCMCDVQAVFSVSYGMVVFIPLELSSLIALFRL